jgi:tetratricopeptide (TPR) repeat protein
MCETGKIGGSIRFSFRDSSEPLVSWPDNHTRMARHPSVNPSSPRGTPVTGLGVDVPELQRARALWQQNRFDESVALFERAALKYPQNLLALTDASRALGARFEIAKAEKLLDRMVALGGRNPQVLHLAGQSYRMILRPQKAIDCFQRALSLRRDITDAHLELAVLYERRHQLAEAGACIEECLRSAPDYWEARLMRARLLRRRGNESEAESRRISGHTPRGRLPSPLSANLRPARPSPRAGRSTSGSASSDQSLR